MRDSSGKPRKIPFQGKRTFLLFARGSLISLFLLLAGLTVRAEENLFDGKSLDDFTVLLKDNSNAPHVFSLQDGILKVTANDSGWLMTKKEYENVHFSVEVCYPTSGFVDSGVTFWMNPVPGSEKHMSGLEVQMKSTDIGDLWGCAGFEIHCGSAFFHSHTETGSGMKYCRAARRENSSVKPGEWMLLEMICSPAGEITIKVDGKVVNQCRTEERLKGRIGFQTKPYPQGKAPIWYRNAKIKSKIQEK